MNIKNWRFNPFTGVTNSLLIENEIHTIEYKDDWNGYGIQLNEAPELDVPSSVVVTENITGGAEFDEVPRTQSPSSGEFRVDYDADTYYGTGRIEFNPADNGTEVLVNYYGNGSVVKAGYQGNITFDSDIAITGKIEVDEIVEKTVDNGVDIEDANIKNKALKIDTISEITTDNGVDIEGINIKDAKITNDLTIATGKDLKQAGTGRHEHGGTNVDGYATSGEVLRTKIVDIGDWNMDANANKPVTVSMGGASNFLKIRSVNVVIKHDNGTNISLLNRFGNSADPHLAAGGVENFDESTDTISIYRRAGGYFDNVNFNSTSFNRGWITIQYID